MSTHVHGASCACPHHHAPRRASFFASLLPMLSCATCPACMALWKPMLSILGVTLALSEAQHEALLFGSLAVALLVAAWDLRRSGARLAFGLTVLGAAFMAGSHLLGELAALEWTGMALMLASLPARWARRTPLRAGGRVVVCRPSTERP